MKNFLIQILGVNYMVRLVGLLQFIIQTSFNYYLSLAPGSVMDWKLFGISLMGAIMTFFTKGKDVTGGTIPATTEAAARSTSPKV
jgi:hypothetical protein